MQEWQPIETIPVDGTEIECKGCYQDGKFIPVAWRPIKALPNTEPMQANWYRFIDNLPLKDPDKAKLRRALMKEV